MNFDLRKLGIILLVSMFIMPVWSIPLSDTNTTCNGKTNLKNFHLSKEPLKIQTPLNSNQMHNTESKFQYKEYSKTSIKKDGLKNDGLKNDGLKNDGLTILLIPIQMLENGTSSNSTNITYNESLNSSSLDAIQKHYNQTLNEYNSCCNSLNYLNEMNGYLNTNQTNLVSLMNYLLNKKNCFVFNETNKNDYNDLCSKLSEAQENLKTTNNVQTEVNATIKRFTEKKNDYETVLSLLNQTIQNKKISPETQNTIETIAKKYNQTTNDTNNATAPTEPDNTTNNNSGNNKVIDPTNDNPNDNHDNNTPTHNDAICGLDGAIAGFSLLGYSLLSITKFWNIYKTGNIAETMTSYFIHHLNKLRNPVVSEATAAVPEAAAADSLKMIDMIPYLSLSNANTVRSTLIRNIMKYPSTAGDISNMAKISIMKDTVLNPLNENIENYLMGLQELDFNSYIYLSAKSKYGARGAVDELFILASENPETFYKIAGYAGDFGKAVETASVKFCKQCTVIADVGTFMSAVSVVLDVWMVASIVSWAGKEFGWWSKDYVNDWLPF